MSSLAWVPLISLQGKLSHHALTRENRGPVAGISCGRERSGFQTQHQPKRSPNQGIRMSHFCSPFWLYFSVGCNTRNLATQHWWHHLIFLQQVWQPYKVPYRKKSSHHRHWIPKKTRDCVHCYSARHPLPRDFISVWANFKQIWQRLNVSKNTEFLRVPQKLMAT